MHTPDYREAKDTVHLTREIPEHAELAGGMDPYPATVTRRTPGIRTRTGIAVACIAVLASACTSPPSSEPSVPVESASPEASADEQGEVAATGTAAASVEGWRAGPVPGSQEQGPSFPTTWPASLVTGSGQATSLTPVLATPADAALKGRVEIEIVDLSRGGGFGEDGQGDPVGLALEANGPAEGFEVPPRTLRQGSTYLWRARSEGKWRGPWAFTVDTIRAQNAPVDSVSGVGVNLLSGVPATSWTSPTLPGVLNPLSIGLSYRPGQPSTPGLPEGWAWQLPGSGYQRLVESEAQAPPPGGNPASFGGAAGPLSVTIETSTGSGLSYARTPTGGYVPGLADGTPTRYAIEGVMTRVDQGAWQFTTAGGTLVRFVDGYISEEWSGQAPVATFEWDDQGRLIKVTDGISREITLVYEGQGTCPASGWGSEFGVAPGMWCAAIADDGSTSAAGYVGERLGIIADPGGLSVGYGWDGAGRLAAVRGSGAQAAAATSDDAWRGPDLTTSIKYDEEGRVSAVTAPAARPGGSRVTHAYEYPASSLDADTLSASVTESVDGESSEILRVTATSGSWQILRSVSRGRESSNTYDEKSGLLVQGTDPSGRTVSMKLEDNEVVRSSLGPYLGLPEDAMRTRRVLDATAEEPSQGAESPVTAWTGLSAIVWSDGVATPQWWNPEQLGQPDLAGRVGTAGEWTAQATATWQVPRSGDWVIEPLAGEGLAFEVVIDGVRCSPGMGEEACTLRLEEGDHQLKLALQGTDPGSFSVEAGPGGDVKPIPLSALRPNYGVDTVVSTNDDVGSRSFGFTVSSFDEPWTGNPVTTTAPGDRTTSYSYEASDPAKGQWGRQVSATMPGGSTQATAYYGDGEQAQDPCTGTSYDQAGLLRQVTRYDGVTITPVHDDAGRIVAVTTEGGGTGERQCTSYDAAGRETSYTVMTLDKSTIWNSVTSYEWANGLLTTTSTSTVGGNPYTQTSVSDALGRLVAFTDSWGTRTDYEYDARSQVVRRTTVVSGEQDPVLTLEYGYDAATRGIRSLIANGKELARVTYDERGLPIGIDYAAGVTQSLRYDSAGAISGMKLRTQDRAYDQRRTRNDAGRTLSSLLSVSAGGEALTTSEWDYRYDSAGWLSQALLSTKGDSTAFGGPKRQFGYDYGSREKCPSTAGADINRTGGSRDGADYDTCYDERGRLAWTNDPHLAPEGGRAKATWDGLGRLTRLDGTVPLEISWLSDTIASRIAQGDSVTEYLTVFGSTLRETVDGVATQLSYSGPSAELPVIVSDDSGSVIDVLVTLPGGSIAHLEPAGGLRQVDYLDIYSAHLTSTDADGASVGEGEARLAPAFGPYGEPLVVVEEPAPRSRYAWQASADNPSTAGWHDLTLSARPYSPWLGSFLAFDPAPGVSPTGYGYGDGTPIDSPDFTGASGWWQWTSLGGTVLAAIALAVTGDSQTATRTYQWAGRAVAYGLAGTALVAGTIGAWIEQAENPSDVNLSVALLSTIITVAVVLVGVTSTVDAYRSVRDYNANRYSLSTSNASVSDVYEDGNIAPQQDRFSFNSHDQLSLNSRDGDPYQNFVPQN